MRTVLDRLEHPNREGALLYQGWTQLASDAADEIKSLQSALRGLLDGLDLAAKNNDLPLPFVGYGEIFIDKARHALHQSN